MTITKHFPPQKNESNGFDHNLHATARYNKINKALPSILEKKPSNGTFSSQKWFMARKI